MVEDVSGIFLPVYIRHTYVHTYVTFTVGVLVMFVVGSIFQWCYKF